MIVRFQIKNFHCEKFQGEMMKTIKLKTLITLCVLSVNLVSACSAQSAASSDQPSFKKYKSVRAEPGAARVLTITKVKAPFYAARTLVVKGFRDSIPEYQVLKGLTFKAYSLSDDGKYFGGIYYWQTEQDAKNWFNDAWFARVEKKYGVPGTVEYFQVLGTKCAGEITKAEAEFWSVLSLSKNEIKVDMNAAGLIKAIEVKDASGQTGFVTLWNSKTDAEKYFENSEAINTFFDSPILLDNSK